MKAWTDLYEELSEKIATINEIKWVDLWHEQVSYLSEEIPFPTPSVFLAFRTLSCNDKGLLIQDCDTQIDMYLFFESFADTYNGSYNKADAIDFMRLLTKLHRLFHGKNGVNYNEMRRVALEREESGGSGNLYRISFSCIVEDASAVEEFNQQEVSELNIENAPFIKPSNQDSEPLYAVET